MDQLLSEERLFFASIEGFQVEDTSSAASSFHSSPTYQMQDLDKVLNPPPSTTSTLDLLNMPPLKESELIVVDSKDRLFPPDPQAPEPSQNVEDEAMTEHRKTFEEISQRVKEKKPLNFRDVAIYMLGNSNRLLTSEEIVKQGLELGLITTNGKTPAATMSSRINTDIASRGSASIFVKFGLGKFSIRPKFVQHITTNVLTQFEMENNMTLLKGSALKYIPIEHEHKWLEVKDSQIPKSGKGLFAIHPITAGTVFCEYRGEIVEEVGSGGFEDCPYGVSVQMPDGSTKRIDGFRDGKVLSLAPYGNDAGPTFNNAILAEYKEHPGHVFLEATRDIKAGEEILVFYGPPYWGLKQYPIWKTLEEYGNLPEYARQHKGTKIDVEIEEVDLRSNQNTPQKKKNQKHKKVHRTTAPERIFKYQCRLQLDNQIRKIKLTFTRLNDQTAIQLTVNQ